MLKALACRRVEQAGLRQHPNEHLLNLGPAFVREVFNVRGLGALAVEEPGEICRVKLAVEREGFRPQHLFDKLTDKAEPLANGDEQQVSLVARIRVTKELQFLRGDLLKTVADFPEEAGPAGGGSLAKEIMLRRLPCDLLPLVLSAHHFRHGHRFRQVERSREEGERIGGLGGALGHGVKMGSILVSVGFRWNGFQDKRRNEVSRHGYLLPGGKRFRCVYHVC